MSIEENRAALTAAEANYTDALAAEANDRKVLELAELAAGDMPSTKTSKAWDEADRCVRLAVLVRAGAARKVEVARAALIAAEQAGARVALAAALEQADRGKLFVSLAPVVDSLARAESALAVNVHELAEDRIKPLGKALIEKVEALRAIRRAVLAQHAACAAAKDAAAVLGQNVRPSEVPDAHAIALAAVETLALAPIVDAEDTMRHVVGIVHAALSRNGMSVDTPKGFGRRTSTAYFEWARLAIITGDADQAAREVNRAHRTPQEIEIDAARDRAVQSHLAAESARPSPAELERARQERAAGATVQLKNTAAPGLAAQNVANNERTALGAS